MKGQFMVYGPDPVEEAKQATWMKKTGGYAKDMTMRDEFAGRAMQSELANGFHESDFPYCARRAYKLADAMLAAREAK